MQETGPKTQRINIRYFDGVNGIVQQSLSKVTELLHSENARSPAIGTIEKREGQTRFGVDENGGGFSAARNDGLFNFEISCVDPKVYRISDAPIISTNVSVSVHDTINIADVWSGDDYTIFVGDDVTISEPGIASYYYMGTAFLSGVSTANIFRLTTANVWEALDDADAQTLQAGKWDSVQAEDQMFLVNGKALNRIIEDDGVTVKTAANVGSLYNSPVARKIAYYKNRIYLGGFQRNGVDYRTSILRSSYPLGIIALVDGDVSGSATVPVTESKYFYADSGMNEYDVYRGSTKVTTLTVTAVNETTLTISGTTTLKSSDEIWIKGTYDGAKQYRWVNNASSFGQDVKQYDTFRLVGGSECELTMMEPIGNVLMIANKNAMSSWDDYNLYNFDLGIGCSSPRGYVKQLGTLFFIHYSGIYATDGGAPQLMSRKIERYIKGATREGIENAVASYKGLSAFFCIGDVTLYNNDGSIWKVLPDVCLEYNNADKNWYVHTNVPADAMLHVNGTAREQLLFLHSGVGGYSKEFLYGNTDDGEEIFFRADLQRLQFMKEFELFVNPIAIHTETERGSSLLCYVSPDDEGYYQLPGKITKGVSTAKITGRDDDREQPVVCRRLGISYRDDSKQRCRINQVSVEFLPTSASEVAGGQYPN